MNYCHKELQLHLWRYSSPRSTSPSPVAQKGVLQSYGENSYSEKIITNWCFIRVLQAATKRYCKDFERLARFLQEDLLGFIQKGHTPKTAILRSPSPLMLPFASPPWVNSDKPFLRIQVPRKMTEKWRNVMFASSSNKWAK